MDLCDCATYLLAVVIIVFVVIVVFINLYNVWGYTNYPENSPGTEATAPRWRLNRWNQKVPLWSEESDLYYPNLPFANVPISYDPARLAKDERSPRFV